MQYGVTEAKLYDNIKTQICNGEPNVIIRNIDACDFCILPDENLLVACNECFQLYDKNYNKLSVITDVNNEGFSTHFVTTNNVNRIYFSNYNNHKIIMTDLSLNYIKSFGSHGSNSEQFKTPKGVVYHNDVLFVADSNNKQIKLIDSNLDFVIHSFELNIKPCVIKIIDNMLCIQEDSDNTRYIYFYNIDNFSLKYIYKKADGGRVMTIGLSFYQYGYIEGKFYCYNKHGEYIEDIKCSKINKTYYNKNDEIILTYFNGDLLFSSYKNKRVYKIIY